MQTSDHIALTGATGFIGGAIVEAALARGATLAVLVRSESDRSRALAARGVRVVVGDLQDREALARLCAGAKSVVHCAAFMGKKDRAKSVAVNVDGTRHLLEAARGAGVRVFMYVSSISAYRGTDSPTRVFTEALAPTLNPRLNHYSYTKLEGEHLVRSFCAGGPMRFVIVRPTNVYGPGCRPWGTEIEQFTRKFHIAFGRVPFDFVHIEDLVGGMLAALDSEKAWDEDFNLGAEMVAMGDFYEFIARRQGTRVLRVPRPIDAAIRHGIDLFGKLQGQVRSTAYTVHSYYPHDKAAARFGYAPRHSVARAS